MELFKFQVQDELCFISSTKTHITDADIYKFNTCFHQCSAKGRPSKARSAWFQASQLVKEDMSTLIHQMELNCFSLLCLEKNLKDV